jgi:hypothetical protein
VGGPAGWCAGCGALVLQQQRAAVCIYFVRGLSGVRSLLGGGADELVPQCACAAAADSCGVHVLPAGGQRLMNAWVAAAEGDLTNGGLLQLLLCFAVYCCWCYFAVHWDWCCLLLFSQFLQQAFTNIAAGAASAPSPPHRSALYATAVLHALRTTPATPSPQSNCHCPPPQSTTRRASTEWSARLPTSLTTAS